MSVPVTVKQCQLKTSWMFSCVLEEAWLPERFLGPISTHLESYVILMFFHPSQLFPSISMLPQSQSHSFPQKSMSDDSGWSCVRISRELWEGTTWEYIFWWQTRRRFISPGPQNISGGRRLLLAPYPQLTRLAQHRWPHRFLKKTNLYFFLAWAYPEWISPCVCGRNFYVFIQTSVLHPLGNN